MSRGPDFGDYFIKGIVSTLTVIFFVIVVAIFFNAMKDASPNEQTKEIIQEQENNIWSGISMWILITGIGGTIGFLFLIYKFIMWAINEFGESSNLSLIAA